MNDRLSKYVKEIEKFSLEDFQKARIKKISKTLKNEIKSCNSIVFVCTHNSRRSQFCQVWSQILSDIYKLNLSFQSAGVVKTEVYIGVIRSLQRAGVDIDETGTILINNKQVSLFSKSLDEINFKKFISIMTCSDAEKSCPTDPRSKKNISLFYPDPKRFDGTQDEIKEYDFTCKSIAAEINAIFKLLINPI
tara:strand:- start:4029 stop:4604 length:576 start_codon:yes stop_codon:yes gene_type:complete